MKRALLAIALLSIVPCSSAHTQPYIVRVPCANERPSLVPVEWQMWKDLCAEFKDEGNAELKADYQLEELRKSAKETDMDLAFYVKNWITLYRAVKQEQKR